MLLAIMQVWIEPGIEQNPEQGAVVKKLIRKLSGSNEAKIAAELGNFGSNFLPMTLLNQLKEFPRVGLGGFLFCTLFVRPLPGRLRRCGGFPAPPSIRGILGGKFSRLPYISGKLDEGAFPSARFGKCLNRQPRQGFDKVKPTLPDAIGDLPV